VDTVDGTLVEPGTVFTKVWRVRNSGNTVWPETTVLSFVYGDRLDSPDAVQLTSAVAPGQELDISVVMTAPSTTGRFSNYWRLCGPEGSFFGPPLYTRIIVPVLPVHQHAQHAYRKSVEIRKPDVPLYPILAVPVPVDLAVPLVPEVVAPQVIAPVQEAVVFAPEVIAPAVPEVVVAPAEVVVPVELTAEEKAVESIKAMGFEGPILQALRRNGGDIEATINFLLG